MDKSERRELQAILGLFQSPTAPRKGVQALQLLQALDYFAVPEQLWPAGLQLLRLSRLYMDEAATDIMQSIRSLLMEDTRFGGEKYRVWLGVYECCGQGRNVCFGARYMLLDHGYIGRVVRYPHPGSPGAAGRNIPACLRAAIVDKAAADGLTINFEHPSSHGITYNVIAAFACEQAAL